MKEFTRVHIYNLDGKKTTVSIHSTLWGYFVNKKGGKKEARRAIRQRALYDSWTVQNYVMTQVVDLNYMVIKKGPETRAKD